VGKTFTYTATVSGSTNTAVTWLAGGVVGGNATVGTICNTISASCPSLGYYTAPTTITSPGTVVTVMAIAQADTTKSASANVTINIAVSLNVSSTTVTANGSQQFTATVAGTGTTGVTWSVNGIVGGNSTVGTICNAVGPNCPAAGYYAAPTYPPTPNTVTITATSTFSSSITSSATVTLLPPPITVSINPTALSLQVNGTVQFSDLVTTTSSIPIKTTVTWGVEDPGLAGGTLYGTITANGLYTAPASVPPGVTNPIPIYVVSTEDPTKQAIALVTITTAPVPVAISTTSPLPNGNVNSTTAYSTTLLAYGGAQPYTWSISSGSLPPGLSLAPSTGVISGTPTTAGTYNFAATVTDATTPTHETASANLSITINPQLLVTTTALPNGAVSAPYSSAVAATGGVAPLTWSVSPSLPSGLSLNASTGAITGTPASTSAGPYTLTFKVTDSGTPQQTATFSTTITIYTGLTITSLPIPNGVAGTAYSQAVSVGGGTAPYNWSLIAGATQVPACLAVAAAQTSGSNAIAGTSAATSTCAGTYSFTLQVSDSSNPVQTKQQTESVIIYTALTFPTVTLPGAAVGTPYSSALSVSGGTAPYTWSLSNSTLPSCLALASLSTTTGANSITGTPVVGCVGGPYSLTVNVADSSVPPQTQSQTLSITIYPGLTITSAALPNGVAGTAYNQTVSLAGGLAPYTWSISSGAFPTCLTLTTTTATTSTSNSITGTSGSTATCQGTYNFTLQVTDSSVPPQVKTQTESVIIYTALSFPSVTLPGGAVGTAYSSPLSVSGGTAPYNWSISSGALPTCLAFASTSTTTGSNSLTGTPVTACVGGPFSFTMKVTDSSVPPQIQTQNASITIYPGLAITSAALPNGVAGTAYNQTVTLAGGLAPYTWSISSGALPACLTLTTTTATSATSNSITGTSGSTATCQGTYNFTLQVTDSSVPQQVKTQTESVIIYTALSFAAPTVPGGVVGTAYTTTFSASGGTTSYTWTETGALPTGLTLSTAGVLSGTPAAGTAGSYPIVVKVTDSSVPAQVQTQNVTLTIYTALTITSAALPNGVAGTTYSQGVSLAGGTAPYTWSLTGTPPTCLTLTTTTATSATTNSITGSVSSCVGGPYSFTLKVVDSSVPAQTAMQTESVTIYTALTFPAPTVPNGVVSTAYTTTFSANGGTPPYTWSETGTLPTGLTLNPSTGALGGTLGASTAGSYPIVVKVTDSSVPPQIQTQNPTINVYTGLTITSSPLPNGVAGTAYGATVSLAGGKPPYFWGLQSNGTNVPGCLMLANGTQTSTGSNGVISPSAAATNACTGTWNFTLSVGDSSTPQQTQQQTENVTIYTALTFPTATLAPAAVGTPYTGVSLPTPTTGTSPYTYALATGSGPLPTSLGLNASTGAITGTPSTPGSFNFNVTVTDTSIPAQTATTGFTIPVLGVTNGALPSGTVGTLYSQTLTALGGVGTLTWSITNGSLPTCLSLNASSGLISGTPTSVGTCLGTYNFTAVVTDGTSGLSASKPLSITINLAYNITTTTVPNGGVGTPYTSTQLAVTGGTGTLTWTVNSGSLPPGLNLSSSGLLSGTPTAGGQFNFAVQVTDQSTPNKMATQGYTITILSFAPTTIPTGTTNSVYPTVTFTASNGTTPYQWQETGLLPTGITFTPSSTTAVLAGTPTATGTFPITVTVTDSAGTPLVATQNFSLTVNSPQPLTLTTTGLYDGTVGQPYTATLNASGGTPTYQWNILPNLPPCLSLSSGVGAQVSITGTPAATCEGSYTFTVQLMDSTNPTPVIKTQQVSININPAGAAVCETGNESVLSGQYAFELKGFTGTGFQAAVGSITLNGAGQITGGEVDINSAGATAETNTTVNAASSSYTLGADNRGCATIVTTSGTTFTTRIVVGSISGSTATAGSIIEFDPQSTATPPAMFIASGQILQQTTSTTPSTSNFTGLSGNYTRLFSGWDSTAGTRMACASTQTESGGNISNSQKDCNDGGVLSSNTGAGLSTGISTGNQGTYTSPDANGRVTEATGSGSSANARALYINSTATAGVVLTTENNAANTIVMAGQIAQQSGTLAASNGSYAFYMTGLSGTSGGKAEFGYSATTGSGSVTVTDYEFNEGVYESNGTANCTYSVATNGRETVSGCGSGAPVTYFVSPTHAFMVGTDLSVETGQTFAQTVPSTGFSAATVNGETFSGGTTEVLSQNGETENDIITFSGGTEDTLAGTNTSDTISTGYSEAGQVGSIAENGNGPTIAAATGFISQAKNGQTQVQGIAIDATHFLITNNHGSSWPSVSLLGPTTADTSVTISITTPSTSSVNVTAGSTQTLTASVSGTTNTGVTWTVNGITNGNPTWGFITGSGLSVTYNAPSTVPSPSSFTVTATSNADITKTASITVEIYASGAQPVAITTTTLPAGTVGLSYNQGLSAIGGQGPYTWTVISGSLPLGLMLNLDTGFITGTPIAIGGSGLPVAASSFTVEATDASAAQHTATQPLSISVAKSTTAPNGITVSGSNVTGVNLSLSTMTTTLALADVGTCIVGVSCNASVTGIQVSASGAQTASCASTTTPATCTVWLLGQGLTNGTGSQLASGLTVRVTGPSSPDVTVSNISPNTLNGSLTNITFQITVSPSAATGNRDIVVTLGDGETQVYIGAIQIVP
jgi:hypothetical protein